MFCPKCGSNLDDGARFCPKCGNQIAGAKSSPVQPAKRKRKGLAIGITVGAVAVVAVAAIAVYVVFFRPYDIDERTFPDAPLREALERQGDRDGDGKLSREEAATIKRLTLADSSLSSFSGMELLPNLEHLDASNCEGLVDPDFGKVPNLHELDLTGSGVTGIDAAKMPELLKLAAPLTPIDSLDVSHNASLIALDVDPSVDVVGLSETRLKERWELWSCVASGFQGVSEATGLGGPGITGQTYSFTFSDSGALLGSDVQTDTSANTSSEKSLVLNYDDGGFLVGFGEGGSHGATGDYYAFSIDSSGRIISSTLSSSIPSYDGEQVYYDYDSEGRLVREDYVTNGTGRSSGTSYEYNDAGQLISIRSAENYTLTALSYGDNGLVNRFENNCGIFEFEYDSEGRCITKRVHDGNAPMAQGDASYSYDDQGRLVSARRSCNSSAYPFDVEVTCSYDDRGNEVHRDLSMTSASGSVNTGSVDFNYKRTFVRKDEPDVINPLVCGDPTCRIDAQGPMNMGLFANESGIVKASLHNTSAINSDYFI